VSLGVVHSPPLGVVNSPPLSCAGIRRSASLDSSPPSALGVVHSSLLGGVVDSP
jgi:hypothetical protein